MRPKAKIILFGYVAKDPSFPSSKNPNFVTFPLPVTRNWKDKYGVEQTQTDWYEVMTSQERTSDIVRNYVKKGDKIYVEGYPSLNTYASEQDGQTRAKVNVNITEIVLLGSKKDGEENKDKEAEQKPKKNQAPRNTQKESNQGYMAGVHDEQVERHQDLDDDIPF